MIKFTVPGIPVAKARPRVTRTHTYTPQKTKDYEELVKWSFKSAYKGQLLEGPVRIDILLFMYIPKKVSKKRRAMKEAREILPIKQPDWDNMAKSITDALNKLAYEDDNQIVEAHVYKYYSTDPRAEITIQEVTNDKTL